MLEMLSAGPPTFLVTLQNVVLYGFNFKSSMALDADVFETPVSCVMSLSYF
jgi:hypothetical protein